MFIGYYSLIIFELNVRGKGMSMKHRISAISGMGAYLFAAVLFLAARSPVAIAGDAENMGLMYQQEFNRYIVYGDFTNSQMLHSEVEVLYYDRVVAVGYVKELRPSYMVVQVIKFSIDVFLRDATSIRPYTPEKLQTIKKIVTEETPYDYDPYRMTIHPYVTPPNSKVKKIDTEPVLPTTRRESTEKSAEPKYESKRREKAAAEKGDKEKLDSGPALKEKSEADESKSEKSSRRRRKAETSGEKSSDN